MRILVFGDSASTGKGISDANRRWPARLAEKIGDGLHGPIEIVEAPFFATQTTAPDYAARKVDQVNPDVVIIVVGGYGFRLKSVHAKVRRRYGARPARLVKWIEEKAEGRGGVAVASTPRRIAFERGRWLAHRVIGTAPLCTPEEALDIYQRTFALLARKESARVITMHYKRPAALGGLERSENQTWDAQLRADAQLERANERFIALIQSEIDSRHFEQVFFTDARERLKKTYSTLRIDDDGHEAFAELVAERLIATG